MSRCFPHSNGPTSTQGSCASSTRICRWRFIARQCRYSCSRCAGEQDRYWDLYGALFDQRTCLECKGIVAIAEAINLDTSALRACMQGEATQTVINANLSEAELHNIRATPTFIIGPSRRDGTHHDDGKGFALGSIQGLIDQHLQARRTTEPSCHQGIIQQIETRCITPC